MSLQVSQALPPGMPAPGFGARNNPPTILISGPGTVTTTPTTVTISIPTIALAYASAPR